MKKIAAGFILLCLLPACFSTKQTVRTSPVQQEVRKYGNNLQWSINLGKYTPNSQVGIGATGGASWALLLDQDLKQVLRQGAIAAWGLTRPEGAVYAGAGWLVVIRVDNINVTWPMGFGITVTATATIVADVFPGGYPQGSPAFSSSFTGNAQEGFTGAGTVGEDWKTVLSNAIDEAIRSMTGDTMLLGMP
ncbi:MAG: hypothetical protein WC889_16495, partial [Myxococcota bacterium]